MRTTIPIDALPDQLFRSKSADLQEKWRRRESNPRRSSLEGDTCALPDGVSVDQRIENVNGLLEPSRTGSVGGTSLARVPSCPEGRFQILGESAGQSNRRIRPIP